MQAETINCPMCGAAIASDSTQCAFCESRLATIACPECFGLMFKGSKHCPRCGAAAERQESPVAVKRNCPRCKSSLRAVTIGQASLLECAACLGLWVDTTTFEKICSDREQQSAVLGGASLTSPQATAATSGKVTYIPCPECSQLMNRANFARCSGVIIDLCKKHGIWFDKDELTRIVEFIRQGGMEISRAKEKAQLEEERRQLRQEQIAADLHHGAALGIDSEGNRISGIASAGGLLKLLLG